MKRTFLHPLNIVCLAGFVAVATSAEAQTRYCGDRNAVVAQLAEVFGETPQHMGVTNGGNLMETYANLETGTWTTLITELNGRSCLSASGQSFVAIREKPKGKAS